MSVNKKARVHIIVEALDDTYPDPKCSLIYEKPYELLIAGRLSAQCTDARVNIVTKDLFKKYPTLESFADADISAIEAAVKSCGFYRTKAKSIVEMTSQLINTFNGELPQSIEGLTTLSGIGRKTANLIMGDIFNKPAIVTDTHCIRICGRLFLTKKVDPKGVEDDLLKIIPPEISSRFCHQIVQFGRDYCKARAPKCAICPIREKFLSATGEDLVCRL